MNRPQTQPAKLGPLLAVLGLLLAIWFGLAPNASAVCLPLDHGDLFAASTGTGGHQGADPLQPKNRVWENFGSSNEIGPADRPNSLQLRWETHFDRLDLASGVLSYADGNPISLSDPFGLCAQDNACTGGYGKGSQTAGYVGYVMDEIALVPSYIADNGADSFMRNVTDPKFVLTSALGGMGMGGITGGVSRTAEEISIVAETTALESNIIRVQHATGSGTQIMNEGVINSTSNFVYGVVAKTPGVVTTTQSELLSLGARDATHVVEFDVPTSELFLNEVGDVTLSNPVNLSGRNPISLPVPKH